MTLGVNSPICAESDVSADLPVEGVNSTGIYIYDISGCLCQTREA